MRIDFECSGGYAGLLRSFHGDSRDWSPELADELATLVARARLFDPAPEDFPGEGAAPPDVMHYRLTVVDGDRHRTVVCNDVTAPLPLHPLLARLRELAGC